MTIRKILIEPNKILRQVSLPVEKVGKEEQSLMDDMLETMYDANGIGLAAIQVGVPKRIIVMDLSKDEGNKEPRYFVNPIVKNKNKNLATYEESGGGTSVYRTRASNKFFGFSNTYKKKLLTLLI